MHANTRIYCIYMHWHAFTCIYKHTHATIRKNIIKQHENDQKEGVPICTPECHPPPKPTPPATKVTSFRILLNFSNPKGAFRNPSNFPNLLTGLPNLLSFNFLTCFLLVSSVARVAAYLTRAT